jgi:dTDP-4-amino-4,6-dideoxygalactose transaminase
MAIKVFEGPADLAINGAKPAFEQPVHVGRPNIGDRSAFLENINSMLDRAWLSNNGPLVQALEAKICERLNVKHCVAMCNGTIALEIAIRALDLTGEVIVPSYTFVATAHALYWQGITPVFADIDPNTHNLDPEAVRRMITPRTSGIIGVHLWGRPAPIEHLQAVADEHSLKLLFDAAHAFGCSHNNRMIGGFGRLEVLSFHATKFFNTLEGGAIVTNDDSLAQKAKLMRNFGFEDFDRVIHPGTNGKMIEAAAAMGLANLMRIEETIDSNRRNLDAYKKAIADIKGLTLVDYDPDESNNFQYVVLLVGDDSGFTRDDFVTALHAEKILARKYFWPGCHMMKPYRDLFPHAGLVLPNTIEVAKRVVILPTGHALPHEVPSIIASIARILSRRS